DSRRTTRSRRVSLPRAARCARIRVSLLSRRKLRAMDAAADRSWREFSSRGFREHCLARRSSVTAERRTSSLEDSSMVAAEQTGEPAPMRVHPPALVRRTFRSEEHAEDQEEIACPGCGFDRTELVFFSEDWLMGKPGRYRLVRCQRCSLVHLNPRPT